MKLNSVKNGIAKILAGVTLLVSLVAVTGTTAQAQFRGRGFVRPAPRVYAPSRTFVRPRAFVSPRVYVGPRVYDHPRAYFYPRAYPRVYSYSYPYTYGYPSTFSFSFNAPYRGVGYSADQGYVDGRSRGADDARDGRPYSPGSHSHFYDSYSAAYRQAFLRGYDIGYREFAG